MTAIKKKPWPLDSRTVSNLIVVLVGIAFYFALYRFTDVRAKIDMLLNVFMPFIVGFIIAYLLNAPTQYFQDHIFQNVRHGRGLSILTVFALAFAVLIILLNLILPQVMESIMALIGNMNTYLNNLNALVQEAIETFHLEGDGITDLVVTYQDLMTKLTTTLSQQLPELLDFGVAFGKAVGSGVLTGITALISSIYMLSGKGRLVPQLKKLIYAIAPKAKADRFLSVCARANRVFVGFINGKLIDSAIIGVLCFALNLVFRIPYAILVAVVIGVTNIIPFFGPIIGAVPCLMILIIVDPWAALRFGILVIALQQFDGNILGPKILGDSTGLSAIWVLVAIIVGGGLFGFPGMLLGVPTFAVLYSLIREWVNSRLETKGLDGNGDFTAPPQRKEE